MTTGRIALIAGSTGIVGGNLATLLVEQGWTVYGLARWRPSAGGVTSLAADLRERNTLVAALADIALTHLVLLHVAQAVDRSEERRGKRRNSREPVRRATRKPLQHAALVTGTKHYLGPFAAYGQTVAETPFRENAPRLPGLNFYYTQEDAVQRSCRP